MAAQALLFLCSIVASYGRRAVSTSSIHQSLQRQEASTNYWSASFTHGHMEDAWSKSGEWTLHGLWPSWRCYAPDSTACPRFDFNKFPPKLRDELANGSMHLFKDDEFRQHEWLKHGCVVLNELTPTEYFQYSVNVQKFYSKSCAGTKSTSCELCFIRDAHREVPAFSEGSMIRCPPKSSLHPSCFVGTAASAVVDKSQLQTLKFEELTDLVIDGKVHQPEYDWRVPHDRDGQSFGTPKLVSSKNMSIVEGQPEEEAGAKADSLQNHLGKEPSDFEDDLSGSLQDEDAKFEDRNRWLKDWATKVVVKEIQGEHSLNNFQFLKTICEAFRSALQHYVKRKEGVSNRDIVFVFKGGNALRLFMNEFLHSLPSKASTELANFYSSYFRMSDADFSILIRPTLGNYDEVHKDISLLAYLLQARLREDFLAAKQKWFQLFNYNQSQQTKILQHLLEDLKKEAFKVAAVQKEWANVSLKFLNVDEIGSSGPHHLFPSSISNDIAIFPIEGICTAPRCDGLCEREQCESLGGRWQKAPPCSEQQCPFFVFHLKQPGGLPSILPISYNDALSFGNGERTSHFTLVRTKMLFTFAYAKTDREFVPKKLKGELIDVSIPYNNDDMCLEFFTNFDKAGTDAENFTTGATHMFTISPNDFLDPESGDYKLNSEFYWRGGWSYLSSQPTTQFLSVSLYEMQEDLLNILFEGVSRPWDDRKYAKRLNRLMLLCFIELFLVPRQVKEFLEQVLAWIGDPVVLDLPKCPGDVFYKKFLDYIYEYASRHWLWQGFDDLEKPFDDFIARVRQNLQVQIEALKLMKGALVVDHSRIPWYNSSSMYLQVAETMISNTK